MSNNIANATPGPADQLDPSLPPEDAIGREIKRLNGLRNTSGRGGGYNDWIDGQVSSLRKVLAYLPARRAHVAKADLP